MYTVYTRMKFHIDDGAQTKLKEQVAKKLQKGYSVAEIADMLEEEMEVIEKIVREL